MVLGLELENITHQSEVSKKQADKLIHKLDMEEDLPSKGVVGLPNLTPVDNGIDSRKESTVKPSTSLGDKLGNRVWIPS